MTIAVTRTDARVLPVSASGTSAAPSSLTRKVGEETTAPDAVSSSKDTSA